MSMLRSRWAALGAAVAVTLGAGGVSLTQAAIGSGPKPVYVALDAPCRVIDTRSASPIGAGDANALTVQITGTNGDCTGGLAVPADAVAVATNVTVIQPNGAPSGRSFFTVYPTDATRPTTSNLNYVNGQPPTPNKVDVGLSATGQINIYNDEGTAHAAVDVFGYYIDHHHDDRYYTESEVLALLPRVASAVNTSQPSLSDGQALVTVQISLDQPQLVHLTADASIYTTGPQATTCTSDVCQIGITIWNADTNQKISPMNYGAFFRVTDAFAGESLAISVVVPAAAGTHNYRLQTKFLNVVNGQPKPHYARLTATSAPLDGSGALASLAAIEP